MCSYCCVGLLLLYNCVKFLVFILLYVICNNCSVFVSCSCDVLSSGSTGYRLPDKKVRTYFDMNFYRFILLSETKFSFYSHNVYKGHL